MITDLNTVDARYNELRHNEILDITERYFEFYQFL